MDKMEFATRIAEEVGKRMPDATVSVNEVLKNNRTLTGITIKSDNSNIAPTIYVDEFYGGGYTLNAMVDHVIDMYKRSAKPDFNIDEFMDWDKAKHHLSFRLVRREGNEKLLENLPHGSFGDLAVYFAVDVDLGHNKGSIKITNEIADKWGVNTFMLMNSTLDYAPEAKVASILDLIRNMTDIDEDFDDNNIPMKVVTTPNQNYGASVMIYSSAFMKLAEQFDSDLYIIPSSVHELIVVPVGSMEPEMIKSMVVDVNREVVSPEEVLSDNVYYYNKSTGEIEYADSHEVLKLEVA